MALCLYASYFVHGMGVITVAQNMNYFIKKFDTDPAGIATIISFIGLGRFICLFIFGYMSDKFGRRPMFLIGSAFYITFFIGLLFSPSLEVACIMAFCAGAANSSLDTCCYPALMEAYPKATGTSVILLKAVISFGQMLYPLVVGYLLVSEMWYGYGLILPAAILALALFAILWVPFPSNSSAPAADKTAVEGVPVLKAKSKMMVEGLAAAIFGFTAFSTFYIVVVWMPKYAQIFAGLPEPEALRTVSYYSMGSLICVFITAVLVKKIVRPVHLMFLFSLISGFMALAVYIYPSPLMCKVAAFVIGFTAAGGILQLGVTLMAEFFPKSKAQVTSIFMIFGGVANFTIPLFTGYLSTISIQYILLLAAVMGFATAAVSFILLVRFYQNFSIPESDVRLGESMLIKKVEAAA